MEGSRLFTFTIFIYFLSFFAKSNAKINNDSFRKDGIWIDTYNWANYVSYVTPSTDFRQFNNWVIFINGNTAWVMDKRTNCDSSQYPPVVYQIVNYRKDTANTMAVLEDIVMATADARVKKNSDRIFNIVDSPGGTKEFFPYVLLDVSKNSTYLIALHTLNANKLTFIPTVPPLQQSSYAALSPYVIQNTNNNNYNQISYDTIILKILDDSHLVIYVSRNPTSDYKIDLKTPMPVTCQGKTIGYDDFSYTVASYTIVPPQKGGDSLYHIVVKKDNDGDTVWKEFISFEQMLLEITPGANSYNLPEDGPNFMRFRPYKIIV